MLRRPQALAFATVLTVTVGGGLRLATRAGDQVELYLPQSKAVRIPETSWLLTFNGIGYVTLMSGDEETFLAYTVTRPDGSEDPLLDGIEGQHFPPWRVASIEYFPPPPVLDQLRGWLGVADQSKLAALVHLERLDR